MEEKEVKVTNGSTEAKNSENGKSSGIVADGKASSSKKDKGLSPENEKKSFGKDFLKGQQAKFVYAIMTLICAAFVWWIMAPSSKSEKSTKGFNIEMPDADSEKIESDKRKAYASADLQRKQEEKRKAMGTLGDMFGEKKDSADFSLIDDAPKPTKDEINEANSIRSSAAAYKDLNTTLGSFYEQPANGDAEKEELRKRLDELEKEVVNSDNKRQSSVDEQMELMEKSYQLAAKYMPNNGDSSSENTATPKVATSKKPKAKPVRQVSENVVSSLAQPMTDEEFVQSYSERNRFYTAYGSQPESDKNTISACVHGNQTITDGQAVRLRLLEPMGIGERIIPRNTIVVGVARLQGERLGITLSNIEHNGSIIPIDLAVYDIDGQEGIFIPNSMEIDAAKEIGANMGSSLNSSINISTNAGAQLASDLGKGVINGVSQYISKKMRTVKVHLKAGYKVLLYQEDN